MEATNVLGITGPVHVYTKGPTTAVGNGIIIFSGLDWDFAGYGQSIGGDWLEKMLAFEFNANSLPCGFVPSQYFTVTKTADKTQYTIGDDIVFDMSVQNTGQYTAEDTEAVDYPPAQVTCDVTTAEIGDLAPGPAVPAQLTCKATAAGCGLTNSVVVTGNYQGQPIFTGSATSAPFNIGTCGTPAPEFPSMMLPAGMILGLAFIVFTLRTTRKD
jgi:uncharacterized repeat protein (TIGR01451 family)